MKCAGEKDNIFLVASEAVKLPAGLARVAEKARLRTF